MQQCWDVHLVNGSWNFADNLFMLSLYEKNINIFHTFQANFFFNFKIFLSYVCSGIVQFLVGAWNSLKLSSSVGVINLLKPQYFPLPNWRITVPNVLTARIKQVFGLLPVLK